MKDIRVPHKVDFSEVENLLKKLNENDSNQPVNIIISTKVVFIGFGIQVAMLQVLFRWMRGNSNEFILDVKDGADFDKLEDSFFWYVLFSTIWKKNNIVNLQGDNLKPTLRKITEGMNNKIQFLQELPNNEVYLTCFDHYSKEKGLLHWLYPSHEEFLMSPSEIENTIYLAFKSVGRIYKTRLNAALGNVLDNLNIIAWELLKNTHDHARFDVQNSIILSPSTRGMCINLIQGTKESLIKKSDNIGLKDYYESITDGQAFFLEISVFDSGPGLVKRYMGNRWHKDLPIGEEVDIVKSCLRKGSTSVKNWKGQNKGFGLNEVLITLTQLNGFIKIRTNRCSLYRDLVKSPVINNDSQPDDIELLDWSNNSKQYSVQNEAEGSVITILFPLPNTES